jgi:hypothetical protein
MNNKQKPFIGIPLTTDNYLLNINKINNNIKKNNESLIDIICNIILEEFN